MYLLNVFRVCVSARENRFVPFGSIPEISEGWVNPDLKNCRYREKFSSFFCF